MSWSKQIQLTRILFTTYILILVIAGYFLYSYIDKLSSSQDLVTHTIRTKLSLEEALHYVTDAETSQRGYLLTKDSSFFDLYNEGTKNTNQTIADIITLTKEDDNQQQNIKTLTRLVNKRFTLLGRLFAVDSNYKEDRLSAILNGKQVMDSLRNHINAMVDTEDKHLQKGEELQNKYALFTPRYALGILIFSALVISFCYFWLLRGMKKAGK